MAHGFRCTRCGHQEIEHTSVDIDDPDKKLPGYKIALAECRKYISPDPKTEEELWKNDPDKARFG